MIVECTGWFIVFLTCFFNVRTILLFNLIQFTKFKATCIYQWFDLGRCSKFFSYVLKHVLYIFSTFKLTILCLCQNCYTVNIYVFPISTNFMISKQLPQHLFRLFCFFGIIVLPTAGNFPPQFVYLTGSAAYCFK